MSPRHRIRLAVLLATLAFVVASAMPSAASAGPDLRGVDVHALWWDYSTTEMDRQLDLARQAGSTAIRVDVSWADIETQGKSRWNQMYLGRLDHFINGANRRGMRVIATLWATPCWASSAPDTVKQSCRDGWFNRGVPQYPPTHPSDYGDAVRFMTARYGTGLAAIEVWNEPDLAGTRFWNTSDRAGDYAALIKAAFVGGKSGDPRVSILMGSIDSADTAFLNALWSLGVQGSYDGVAVHPYADEGFRRTAAIHDLQQARGDNTPIWITEFGWPTGTNGQWSVTEDEQAGQITRAFGDLSRLPFVAAATVYDLRDDGTDPGAMDSNFGLVHHDYSLKPAFAAMRAALGAPPETAPAVTAPPALIFAVRRRAGTVYAVGRAPAHRVVRMRISRCRRIHRRVLATRVRGNGRFARRLGRVRRLRGCRITATLVHVRVHAVTARIP